MRRRRDARLAGLAAAVAVGVVAVAMAGGSSPSNQVASSARPGSPRLLPSVSMPPPKKTDLFVEPSGADTADGTRGRPLRSLQLAVQRAKPGDTVWVAPGTYAGFAMGRGGEAGRPVTVAALRSGVVIQAAGQGVTIDLREVHDVTLTGLTIRGPTGQGLAAVLITNSARVRIENSVITGSRGGFGIDLHHSSDSVIRGNDITRNAVGIRLFGEGRPSAVANVTIDGNRIHDNDSMVVNDPAPNNDFGANAIIWHKVDGPTVARGNQVWANRAPSIDYGIDGGAFEIWGSSNITISDNVAWDNVNVVETGTDGPACQRIRFERNVAYTVQHGVGLILRCASDSLVAHNTIVGVAAYAFELSHGASSFGGSIEGLRILNNLVADTRLLVTHGQLPTTVQVDYNLIWRPGQAIAQIDGRGETGNLQDLQAWTGLQIHGIAADPRFTDPAQRDYRLASGSPAIDRGTPLPGESDVGAAPDIGRFELGSPAS